MKSNFKALTLSYKNAPVAIRELIALDDSLVKELLSEAKDLFGIADLLILSTCNRTEFYYTSKEDLSLQFLHWIGAKKGIHNASDFAPHFISLTIDRDAVNHLFRVAMGLEAQVVGDMQISNQMKRAYQYSADAGLAGPFLHRVMHTIFFSSKRVAQETGFRDGAASVSYVAWELIQTLTESLIDAKVLILGLGEIGSDVCRHFTGTNANVVICNRTEEKADLLALECGLKTAPFEKVNQAIQEADIVISSVSTKDPFITADMVETSGMKYFIDLSVPRSVDPQVAEVQGVTVFNIDDIHLKASAAVEKRKASIPAVEQIIAESVGEFAEWTREMTVSPTIQKLKSALEQIRREELARHLKSASDEEKKLAEKLSKGITQKIMKLPVLQLKAACKRGEADTLIDILNDLFDLEKQHQSK